jgi:hypothetical protein
MTIEKRIERLERNGHALQPKPERRWTTAADLDALYAYMFENGPRPPSHLTPEEERMLDVMYDKIVEDL